MRNDMKPKNLSNEMSSIIEDNQIVDSTSFVGRLALRPKEVSSATGLSLPLIYGLLRLDSNGGLRHIRVNNSILIPVETLREDLVKLAGKEIKV